jgi:hypothetical protein
MTAYGWTAKRELWKGDTSSQKGLDFEVKNKLAKRDSEADESPRELLRAHESF